MGTKPTVPWENYVQLEVTNRHHRSEIHLALQDQGFDIHWSKKNITYDQAFILINVKRKTAVWNTIKTEARCCLVDDAWFAQFELLRNISQEAQVELILNPC